MAQIKLDKLTEEELVALRSEINDKISEFRKMERSEETTLLKKKYEGKFFYDASKQVFYHITEVIDKYQANAWVCSIERSDDESLSTFIIKHIKTPYDAPHLFVPKISMMGTVMQPSAISSCEEIGAEDAKKLISLLFNEVNKNFFEE